MDVRRDFFSADIIYNIGPNYNNHWEIVSQHKIWAPFGKAEGKSSLGYCNTNKKVAYKCNTDSGGNVKVTIFGDRI